MRLTRVDHALLQGAADATGDTWQVDREAMVGVAFSDRGIVGLTVAVDMTAAWGETRRAAVEVAAAQDSPTGPVELRIGKVRATVAGWPTAQETREAAAAAALRHAVRSGALQHAVAATTGRGTS